jgi:hypothetical protein
MGAYAIEGPLRGAGGAVFGSSLARLGYTRACCLADLEECNIATASLGIVVIIPTGVQDLLVIGKAN